MARKKKRNKRKKNNRSPRLNVVLSNVSRPIVEQLSTDHDLPLAQVVVRLVRWCIDSKTNAELGSIIYFPDDPDDEDEDYVSISKDTLGASSVLVKDTSGKMKTFPETLAATPTPQLTIVALADPSLGQICHNPAPRTPLIAAQEPQAAAAVTPAQPIQIAPAPTPAPAPELVQQVAVEQPVFNLEPPAELQLPAESAEAVSPAAPETVVVSEDVSIAEEEPELGDATLARGLLSEELESLLPGKRSPCGLIGGLS